MTSYTTISNAEIDQDSPATQPLFTSLRDNPIAIAEGAVGAPRIEGIDAMSHQGAVAAVGTYVFARSSAAADVAVGGTIAGSNLLPTSAWAYCASAGPNTNTMAVGAALTGTWRCMGFYDALNAVAAYGTVYGATLWLRIS